MRCNFKGCRGEYGRKLVSQVFSRRGESLVIKDIPAGVCSAKEAVRQLETLLRSAAQGKR